ncbi:MAG: DNA cytosine methyltransferase [Aureispira sp.]
MDKRLTVIDVFSGCGGMSWGLHKAGFNIVAALDTCNIALKTFSRNHPATKIICGDIRETPAKKLREELKLAKGSLTCLVGGPPCQGFSKNVRASYRFLEDPRNQLYNDYLDYVEEFAPQVAIMENVAEIYNAFEGKVRKQIIARFSELGYKTTVKVLFGPDYGIPQRRRRCFFFATKSNVKPRFPEPLFFKESEVNLFGNKPKYVSAWEAISDLPSLQNGEGSFQMKYSLPPQNDFQQFMRKDSTTLFNHEANKLREKQLKRIKSLKPGQGIKNLPDDLRPKSGYSGAYGRLDFENVAPTITRWMFHIGSGRYGHPKDDRLITIREGARIQCFTDDFVFEGTYIQKSNQIGNAVPSLFMYHLAPKIFECLEVENTASL